MPAVQDTSFIRQAIWNTGYKKYCVYLFYIYIPNPPNPFTDMKPKVLRHLGLWILNNLSFWGNTTQELLEWKSELKWNHKDTFLFYFFVFISLHIVTQVHFVFVFLIY